MEMKWHQFQEEAFEGFVGHRDLLHISQCLEHFVSLELHHRKLNFYYIENLNKNVEIISSTIIFPSDHKENHSKKDENQLYNSSELPCTPSTCT